MGGKALKTGRISRERYFQLKTEVETILTNLGFTWVIMPEPTDKLDFGDIDVLIKGYQPTPDFLKRIEPYFNTTQRVISGNCISLPFNGFQVDLIRFQEKHWGLATFYYGNTDACIVLGRLGRACKLKFGWDGLEFLYTDSKGQLQEIPISFDTDRILGLFGYTKDRITQAVTLETLRDAIVASPQFDAEYLVRPSTNRTHRVREKERSRFAQLHEMLVPIATSRPASRITTEEALARVTIAFPEAQLPEHIVNHEQTLRQTASHQNSTNKKLRQ